MPKFRALQDRTVIPEPIYEPVPPDADGLRRLPKGRTVTVTADAAAILRGLPDEWEDVDATLRAQLASHIAPAFPGPTAAAQAFGPERNTMIAGPQAVKVEDEVRLVTGIAADGSGPKGEE